MTKAKQCWRRTLQMNFEKNKDLLTFPSLAAIRARLDTMCGLNLLVFFSTLSGFSTGNLI